jgi:superoxide reductase
MTTLNQIWKCEVCGNIIEIVHAGADALVCCNQPMKLIGENTEDAAQEKHVPIIESRDENKSLVKVGSVPHPMDDDHYIEWIEIDNTEKQKTCRKDLKPGEKPEAKFCSKPENAKARAYCNLHGLWKSE